MTPDLPPQPPGYVYPHDRTMAGAFELGYARFGADAAVLVAASGMQFFTPHVWAGLVGGVGPLVSGPGGMGLVGPAFGATGAIGGPWRLGGSLALVMGGLSRPGTAGQFLTAALPKLELGYHLDPSSRLSLGLGLLAPFGEPATPTLSIGFATRHGLPYREDPGY